MEILQLEDQNVKKKHVSEDLALVWAEHPLEDLEANNEAASSESVHD